MWVMAAGWATPRSIIEEDGKVLFEVAESDGCWTCRSRIEHVRAMVREKGLSADFRTMPSSFGPCVFVVLDAAPQGVDVREHVGGLLSLRIS